MKGLLVCIGLCACTSIGRDLASGAGDGLKPQLRQLTYEAAGGVKDNLLSEDTKKRVLDLERAVVSGATESLTSQETQERLRNLENALIDQLRVDLLKTENSLLGEELDKKLAALRQELIGPATKADLVSIRDELLGPRLHEAVAALIQDALGPQTQTQVGALRDQLVGKPMQDAIDALIKQATKTLASEWQNTVRPVLDDSEKRARNIAIWVAVGVGVVSAGVIFQAHYLRGKYKGIATLLAAKIEEVAPTHGAPIKQEIEKEAISKGLERNLHQLLYDAGINKT
jgi:hypothetical protein